jgi:branched-chain amino acid aminotransferase
MHRNPNPKRYFYGDGFFESLIVDKGVIPFWKWHVDRIFQTLAFFKADPIDPIEITQLKKEVESSCIDPDKCYRVRIVFNREREGTYRPQSRRYSYDLKIDLLEVPFFCTLHPINLDSYTMLFKPSFSLSNYKTQNALLYVMAQQDAAEKGRDDMVLFNERNEVVESSNSNLFIIKNDVIYTPPLSSGCLDGIMRRIVCHVFSVIEKVLHEEDLLMADEIFLTSGISGIKIVSQYKDTRYPSAKTSELQITLKRFYRQQLADWIKE